MTASRGAGADFRLLVLNRVVRAFGFGFGGVLIGLQLQARGLSPTWIGLTLTLSLGAASLLGLVLAAAAARYGRRVSLAATGVLMALAGLDLAFATSPGLLVLAGLTGMTGASNIDLGPFLALEQAVLTESVDDRRRNLAFGRYSLIGALAGAGGGLAAGLASGPRQLELAFAAFAAIGLVTAVLPLLLSRAVEAELKAPAFGSFRPLAGLSALFALDSFGGGLVATSVVAYWLHVRFGAVAALLGPSFAAISLVQAASYELAGRMSNWIGLVNTMVFTHLPSNVLLILVAFSPSFPVALALLLARNAISQMDIPARQAYIASIVPPEERAGALAVTGAVRGVAQAFGPLLAGLAIQGAALGVPFILGGSVKIVYDLGLYAGFRSRAAEHEAAARRRRAHADASGAPSRPRG